MIRQIRLTLLKAIASLAIGMMTMTSASYAQSQFSAVAEVGTRIVTGYELAQKMRLLDLQGTAGDLRAQALDQLITERLQEIAAERAGVSVSPQALAAAIDEIAARTDRSGEAFLADLAQEGVDTETFLASTRAGIVWRDLIRARYGSLVEVTEAEIDRALGLSGQRGGLEMRFAEIFLPTNTSNNAAITADLAPQIQVVKDFDVFSDAARRFSVGPSASNGGVVPEWVNISDIPPALRAQLLAMRPGDVTEPIDFNSAVGLFQLRGVREAKSQARGSGPMDFVTYVTTQADAARIRERIDTCTDYYGVVRDKSPDRLIRRTLAPAQIPNAVALELARLDAGETSVALSSDGGDSVTMITLCARLPATAATDAEGQQEVRETMRMDLRNRKLTAYSNALLEEIRGDTKISVK